jgi:hypothetical protein
MTNSTVDHPAAPVEPERRTVSLECLTTELRTPPVDPDIDPAKTIWIPDHARVGLVLRTGGQFTVAETDADWVRKHDGPELLSRMLQQAEHYARNGDAELLMPMPDVLAALDGRPDAQLLTAPVWVLALDIEPEMILTPIAGAPHRVTAPPAGCTKPGCKEGASCVVLPLDGGGEQHQSGYARTRVRIPAAVNA